MINKLEKLTFDTLLHYSCSKYKTNLLSKKVGEDIQFTYDDFYHHVMQISTILKSQGIQQGDKVALLSENSPYWSMAYFAVTSMGAVIVPILVDFHPSEVRHIIASSKAKAIFISTKYMNVLDEDFNNNTLEFILNLDDITLSEVTPQRCLELKSKNLFEKFKEKFLPHNRVELSIEEDDLAALIYTSGTTGQSKGVMLSHKNLVSQAVIAQETFQIFESDTMISLLPMAHTFEMSINFIVPFFSGANISYISKVPTPSVLLKALAEVQPTFMLVVPLIIEKIFKNRIMPTFQKNALSRFLYTIPFFKKQLHKIAGKKLHKSFGGNLRFLGIGGSKLSQYVEEFLFDAAFPYAIGYGLTETSPLAVAAVPGKTKVGSCGYTVHSVTTKLDFEASSNPNEGELLIKGPNVMMGYYEDEERTREVLSEDGWYRTGDLAQKESDGRISITGRSKNVIIGASGENIYPENIEAVINQHPFVLESLVYENNSKVAARIYLDYEKIDTTFTSEISDSKIHEKIESILEEVRIYCNKNVAAYARVMQVIEQREAFVMTPTKKIKRFLYTN